MTLANAVLPIARPKVEQSLLPGWTAWLREAIDTNWRPGEWDPDLLLFTGNPDNPSTAIKKCQTAACQIFTQSTWCVICREALAASGMGPDAFAATFIPQRKRAAGGYRLPSCTAAGGSCAREAYTAGYCDRHYYRWAEDRRANPGLEKDKWGARQKPLAPKDDCLVRGCVHESIVIGLCRSHHSQWKRQWSASGQKSERAQLAAWAERQAPYMNLAQFSLAPLSDTVRLEFLYALQRRDADGRPLQPEPIRFAVRQAVGVSSIALTEDAFSSALEGYANGPKGSTVRSLMMRFIKRELGLALLDHQGVKPTDRLVWNARAARIRSRNSESGSVAPHHTVDFGVIRQQWLRATVMEWARTTTPEIHDLRSRIRSCEIASRTLSYRSGGGSIITDLGFADMTSVFETFNQLRKDDGSLYSDKNRRGMFRYFTEILDFGRMTGRLAELPAAFSRNTKHHKIKVDVTDEDEIGKALPESVIDQLDTHVDLLGKGVTYGSMAEADVQLMLRTAYILMRNTGRRPAEIAGARFECLDRDGDEWQLIWDNFKAKRLGRRLPIFDEEVQAILGWRARLNELGYPTGKGAHLFPPKRGGKRSMRPASLAAAIRQWVDSIPVINSEIHGQDGTPPPFDRSLIYPYAFRHTYCQRHADGGVPLDTLMELMDHENAQVTRGYYKVSLKRKREAADIVRRHLLDRSGRPLAGGSAVGYERRSVAVPYGNCKEPTNVKAGGNACPIRFQCAGCPSYEAEPSYLPALEDHLIRLKAGREIALASGVQRYVIDGMDGEIRDYSNVVATMRDMLAALPAEERREVEEASRLLRRSRAGSVTTAAAPYAGPSGQPLLPLTVVHRNPTGANQ